MPSKRSLQRQIEILEDRIATQSRLLVEMAEAHAKLVKLVNGLLDLSGQALKPERPVDPGDL